jgi:hypothetical protein
LLKKKQAKVLVVARPEPMQVSHEVPLNHQLFSLLARCLDMFLKTMPHFKIDQTLAQLMVAPFSEEKLSLEAVCEQALRLNQALQVLSDIWVDIESTLIFAYFSW